MDPSLFKDFSLESLTYHYYYKPSKLVTNPTLLFLHGFPSTSGHWKHQVVYFSNKGYGIIALDMLGYGGTTKTEDARLYGGTVHARHCIAILDAEGLDKVIVVSHDWGCKIGSRVADLYPERHLCSIFISLSYLPFEPNKNAEDIINGAKLTLGKDIYSYWLFLGSDEAPSILAEHEESFYSLIFTSDPEYWSKHFGPEGELKKWLLEDKRAPLANWAPNKDVHIKTFRAGGWYAPTNWYRTKLRKALADEDKDYAGQPPKIIHPVLQVLTLRDAVCLPVVSKYLASTSCTNVTFREIDTGHWPMFEKPDELNAIIDEFLRSL